MVSIPRGQVAGMNQHYQRFSLDYFLDSQRAAGFTSIDLWCGPPHVWVDAAGFEDPAALRRRAADRGLAIVSLTLPSFARQYQVAAPAGAPAEASFRYFANGIRLAAALGAGVMAVNSGWGLLDEPAGAAWNRSRDMLGRLGELAGREGVVLALESLRADESDLVNDLASAVRMHREVGHPALRMMVDTIAAGAAGETLEDWFRAFGSDVVHMHFLDGDPYVHAIWGDGNYPLEAMLRTLAEWDFRGCLVQEVADERYFADPARADLENMRVLGQYFEDREGSNHG
jgi:protein FrlC